MLFIPFVAKCSFGMKEKGGNYGLGIKLVTFPTLALVYSIG